MKILFLLFSLIIPFQGNLKDHETYIRIKNETKIKLENIEIHNGSESKVVKIDHLAAGTLSTYQKVEVAYTDPLVHANELRSYLEGEDRSLGEKLPPGKYTYILFMKDLSRNLLGIKLRKDRVK